MQNDDIRQSIDEGRRLWQLVQEYAKLEMVEKLSFLLTVFILGGVLFALCSIALYCFCMYLVTILAAQTDNLALSYSIVGFALLLAGFLIYWFRERLIVRPLIRSLMEEFFKKKEEEDLTDGLPQH